ncbi:MAG: hypothetical protein KIT00_05555, partial [Rhodospirillales bacterium]|nr:hypothetical protein [Rhodospirillales bacterium]
MGSESKTLNTDFLVSVDSQGAGGVVTFLSGQPADATITIVRSLVIERTSDFQSSGLFRAETLNSELDFQVAALQDLASERDRSVRLAPSDEDADLVLPPRQERAGKMPSFDASGNLTLTDPASLGGGGGGGATDHGVLSGLGDDDHPQYHSDARGDARYYTKSQLDTALTGKSETSHNHDGDYAAASHTGNTANPHGVTAAQVGAPPTARTITARQSLTGGGDLSTNRTINLVNDADLPGANKVYGTDADGVRGWKDDPVDNGGVTNHGALAGLSADDHLQYHTDARGDARYYTQSQLDTALTAKSNVSHNHDGDYAAASHAGNTANPHEVTAAQVGAAPTTRAIATEHSLMGGGDLNANRTISLVNDEAVPGANKVYGTNADGVRGWKDDPVDSGGATNHGALAGLGDDDHPQYHTDTRGDARYYTQSQVDATLAGKSDIGHDHVGVYEPVFLKNSGFNKDLGTIAGTVSEGNHTHDATYAPIAQGVANGNNHDHSGGDGAQIDHASLSNVGLNTHLQIDSHLASTANPHGVTKSQVGLGNVENTKTNFSATTAPTATDDTTAGYSVGSLWADTFGDKAYICFNAATGAAIWVDITQAGSGGGGSLPT